MLVVIPFCARDKALAVRLAGWIAKIGGAEKHDCLLVVHKDTDSAEVIDPLTDTFGRIAELIITDDMIVERDQHTYAANLMWKRAVNHIADMNESQPFLWLETDCVPIDDPGRGNWLDAIAEAYRIFAKPFMHCLVQTERGKSNSGCGVYPAKVRDFTSRLWELSNVSWDILLYEDFAPHTAYTTLIQDVGFLADGKTIPTFPDQASLSIIRPEVVLFHRCKDGTLIDRIQNRTADPLGLMKADPDLAKFRVSVGTGLLERKDTHETTQREQGLLERIAQLEALLKPAALPHPNSTPRKRATAKPKRKLSPERRKQLGDILAKARAAKKVAK